MASLPSSASSVAAPAPPVESDVAIGENDGAQAAQVPWNCGMAGSTGEKAFDVGINMYN